MNECCNKFKLISINNNIIINNIHNKLQKNVRSKWILITKSILNKIYMLNIRYIIGYYIDYYEQVNNIIII